MGEAEGFINQYHLYIDCYVFQTNTVLPEIELVLTYDSYHLSSQAI